MPYNNSHIKGWVRIIIFIIAFLFFAILFQIITFFVADIEIGASFEDYTAKQRLISSFFEFLAYLSVLWLCMKIIDNEPFQNLGLRIKDRGKDILFGLVSGFIIMGFGFTFLNMICEIEYSNVVISIKKLLYVIVLYTIVSFKEELVFRGYLLRNLMYSFGKPIALIVSSVLFSIVHGRNPHFDYFAFINLFLAGIMLGLPYLFNKNLWFPIALHFSWNFFQSLFGFNVSGLDSYSIIEFNIPKNNILNGGDFGFEGSILSIIIQVLMIIGLYIWYKKDAKSKVMDNSI